MRKFLCLLFGITILFALAACSPTNNRPSSGVAAESDEGSRLDIPPLGSEPAEATEQPTEVGKENKVKENSGIEIPIYIIIGGTTFPATLYNNETTQALVAQFPMTIRMNEQNRLEKYNDLSEELPAASTERPATIHAGDIMSWSGNTLVLFYQTFSNSYDGYVPLGSVDDPANLAAALGSGNVQVTWSLAD
ncbi:cyclophilin-like fold protein [Paenibacillus pedocola]|uniref:cyclophilin-like fold protein n=1 Tax=Paenibacillus pedocola TaxID=3242193 RepID=UPI00287730B3|nr:cyclophilin-like fold protein [Paenibacillus typhae]